MDKYTIDLDQVLNDFEYLELTDQHTRNVSNESNNNSTLASPIITKHSIHNVFHSLNEYLTTSISQKNEHKQVVESDENLENIDNTSINHAGFSKDKEQVQECLANSITSTNVSQDKTLLENEDLSNNSSYCGSPLISIETNKDVNSTDNKIDLKDEHEEVGTSNKTVHFFDESTSKPYNDFKETDELGLSPDIKSDIILKEHIEIHDHDEHRPSKTTDDFVSNNTHETNNKMLIKNDVEQENIEKYVIEPSSSLDLLELKHENPNSIYEKEDTNGQKNLVSEKVISDRSDLYYGNNGVPDQVIESQSSNNCEQPKNKTKIVGFSTDIEIEEQEFNELLDNFEQEVTENIDSSMMDTEFTVEGKETNFEYEIAKEKSNINDVNIDQEMNGRNLSKSLNEHNNTMQSREHFVDTSEKIKVEDASNVHIEDENLNSNQESTDMSEKCDVSIQNKSMSPLKKNYSQDSLTRPQNLLLNNEVKENGNITGRKIDLIGMKMKKYREKNCKIL